MITQKEGVYNAIVNVLANAGVKLEGKVAMTKEQRAEVIEIVSVGIHEGEISFSDEARAKYNTFEAIKTKYVPYMVFNWTIKDTRLNGGIKHTIKNPGTRAGGGDSIMRNLKALRSQVALLGDAGSLAAVDQEIGKRATELKASKAKTITIDIDKIPEALRHLIPTK